MPFIKAKVPPWHLWKALDNILFLNYMLLKTLYCLDTVLTNQITKKFKKLKKPPVNSKVPAFKFTGAFFYTHPTKMTKNKNRDMYHHKIS